MGLSNPKVLKDFEDCKNRYKYIQRLVNISFFILIFSLFFAWLTYDIFYLFYWLPMLFTAIAIFVAFFFGFYASAVGSLKVVEKRISKHKNPETIISDFAILCEYEADQLGLETVNKIEFRLKTPKD